MAEMITKIYRVTDPEFRPFGTVLDVDCSALISEARKLTTPDEGATYLASIPALEACPEFKFFQNEVYGELPIQIGCCWGHNAQMNAMEWHKSSEINIAATDFVLLLGNVSDVQNACYDSSNVKAFLVRAGEVVEVYATTLHFCPCQTSELGFNCLVVLPRDTNLPLDGTPADRLLFRKNKWILAHEENSALISKGVVGGIFGENWVV